MTGPEHYREAEGLIAHAKRATDEPDVARMFMAQCAQVHATLALAAATAEVEPTKAWYETVVGTESPAVKP